MKIIIFQLLSCLYFYDSGIEVPVCIKKPSQSTVYQPERSYTVPSVNRLPAGSFIYRAVGQQTPSSVESLRKVGRPSPGVKSVKSNICYIPPEILASPVPQPFSIRHSSSNALPAARCIAPSTIYIQYSPYNNMAKK